ncbi:MAG: glycine cleavage system aminomethyltransferase GcvT [Burkholderiaceae bacterium]|nr:MAG: glycine cleavage system aminomethyltransferase GcvT [Burkholderiaceae bacterium]
MSITVLKRTPLHDLHLELGAKMVPFAGYEMPVQYPMGVLKEHLHTRAQAGLFDVSHMGQIKLIGFDAASALETLVPMDIIDLPPMQQRYALFTNSSGNILDDLMVTNAGDHLFVVVNAACKEQDTLHLRQQIGVACEVQGMNHHALLALQGPQAAQVMQRVAPGVDYAAWTFMTARPLVIDGIECFVTRSGYTGEDGFELSIHNDHATKVARLLLAQPEVAPIGLGARDSLRLEAGLCLYGHDIDDETTPVEAALLWALPKVRRHGGARSGGFPGAHEIFQQMELGVIAKRAGLIGDERAPVREGAELVNADDEPIGTVTSGGFSPTLGKPIAMAKLSTLYTDPGTQVFAKVRDKRIPMTVSKMPFVPNRYYRGK